MIKKIKCQIIFGLVVVLSGCGGGGVVDTPPSAVLKQMLPTITMVSGDSQIMTQHGKTQLFVVSVKDAQGNPAAYADVQFSTGLKSETIFTNKEGKASWQVYLHDSGIQKVKATANGFGTITFIVNAIASSYKYDGAYACVTGDKFNIVSNVIDNSDPANPRTFDAFTGAIHLTGKGTKWNRPTSRYEGFVVVDSLQKATVTGTEFESSSPAAPVQFAERIVGSWNCYRE